MAAYWGEPPPKPQASKVKAEDTDIHTTRLLQLLAPLRNPEKEAGRAINLGPLSGEWRGVSVFV